MTPMTFLSVYKGGILTITIELPIYETLKQRVEQKKQTRLPYPHTQGVTVFWQQEDPPSEYTDQLMQPKAGVLWS